MASVHLSDAQGLKPFDCSETAGISARWERWLRAFELFATGKGITDVDQKKALLLHTAGLRGSLPKSCLLYTSPSPRD